ncbi:MAG: hypothetical protein JW749_07200 [Sedimentisphaerales bacterium]|nr:hypothetical protein [Sedimentisphaerales bacterium]
MAWGVGERKIEVRRNTGGKIVELGGEQQTSGDESMEKKTRAGRNLGGGMDLLEMDFLLGVIENTDGDDKNDVAMRKLSFNEVLRRNQQSEIDSSALTVYAVDDKRLYTKEIQCAAMKELNRRTEQKSS